MLRPFVRDVFGDQNPDFDPGLPEHILASFRPGAGRFLTWHGYPGVSIDLEPRDFAQNESGEGEIASNDSSSSRATLFMIHAPDNAQLFGTRHEPGSTSSLARPAGYKPESSILNKESVEKSSSLTRQVKGLWREGGVTYLLLDAPPVTE